MKEDRIVHITRTFGVFIILVSLTLSTMSQAQAQNAYELRQSWQTITELVAAQGRQAEAEQIRNSISTISDEELERVYRQVDLDNMISTLEDIQEAVNVVDSLNGKMSVQKYMDRNSISQQATTAKDGPEINMVPNGFPTDLDYPNSVYCPLSPERSDDLALQIAVDAIQVGRVALEVAKGIWSGVSRGCEETVVFLGEGGNLSLACIPFDIVLFAAEAVVGAAEGVVEHFEFCDSGVDSAEIEGTWDGLGHVNSVLTGHVAQLTTHDTDIKYELELINGEIDLIHSKLDEQKGMLETVLSNQEEIMNLLKTPSGRRPDWNNK